MTCTTCGLPAVVHYVIYQPLAHVFDLCGGCACYRLGDLPARAWLRLDGRDPADVPMGRAA